MFWSDTSADRIYRARLNGTQLTTIISSGLSYTGILVSQAQSILNFGALVQGDWHGTGSMKSSIGVMST